MTALPTPEGLRKIGAFSVILPRRVLAVQAALVILLAVLALWSLSQGRRWIAPDEIWQALTVADNPAARLMTTIRLPRLLTAMLAGAALAMSGAAMQSVSRNPLGSPDIIGLTTGAATGALIWMMTVGPDMAGVAASAIAGAALAAAAVLWLARGRGARGLVLSGFGIGAALAAVNGVILVRGDLDRVMGAALWLAGSLDARAAAHVWIAGAGLALAGLPLLALARGLALAEMGDDIARALGTQVDRQRRIATLAAVVLAAAATAAVGPVPFIALAAPQIARALTGAQGPAFVSSALTGAAITLTADMATRSLPFAVAVPVGHAMGILGGIYLIGLLALRARGPRA